MPLLAGARTGYMHPKCYAAASRDCSEKISQEHWLSADVLRGMTNGKTITVLGMPWQKGSTHQLPVSALAANILCQRHNSALSPLDVSASSAFRVLWHFQEDQRRVPDPHGAEFALVNGDELERWLLKLLWGAVAAGALSHEGNPVRALHSSASKEALLDYLFRDGTLPEGWGRRSPSSCPTRSKFATPPSTRPYAGRPPGYSQPSGDSSRTQTSHRRPGRRGLSQSDEAARCRPRRRSLPADRHSLVLRGLGRGPVAPGAGRLLRRPVGAVFWRRCR